MEKKTTITYNWKRDDGKKIPKKHEYQLIDHALNHISEQLQQGYTSGELIETISDGSKKGIDCSGWFEIKTE